MTPVLVFDIETIPDIEGIRKIFGIGAEATEAQVAEIAFQKRRQTHNTEFLPLHLHRVVAISCALRDRDSFKIWSLGAPEDSEATLIRRFFEGIEKFTPQIVSWNGTGFDLPVLHYRSLVHGIQAPKYWDFGDDDKEFRWNNYINRYHYRHLDLMDVLSLFQPRACVPLDEISQLIGCPGKLGMDGSKVWDAYQAGELVAIRDYCDTDVANTYLVYLRFQMLRGLIDTAGYAAECAMVRARVSDSQEPHWKAFLDRWGSHA